ncbi:hypothetical protein M422DRAFT_780955 [Sphaerobolus stellatus SS14]|uniref:GDP/GTP exchange factor Sec2 N-terminal domain-containing protein n=1 Tax=Sphaerobolus stellatus (strain SS14) TaxID=990650 RepID=A0A0C9UXW1_SPHS4|nr:hypothetical protein M422DRAFT_780955 [Sphaerobolus stellatus SS14]
MTTTLPGTFPNSPKQPPRRTDSLSSSIAKPKPTSPIIQSADDAKAARALLETPLSTLKAEDRLGPEERERRREEREGELVDMLAKMTGRVEELGGLLTQAYKNQTDLETALTLTRSNLQLALANNEMLEDALKRTGENGKDVGWRRWSEREDLRRSNSLKDHHPTRSLDTTPPSSTPPSTSSRFFNFTSSFRSSSASPSNTSPTTSTIPNAASSADSPAAFNPTPALLPPFTAGPSTASGSGSTSPPPPPPPPSGPTQKEKELTAEVEKLRTKADELTAAKEQLEDELESLSQALFEEANKMVADANRKAAETEEELRIVADQRDALKGAMRIVETENNALRSKQQASSSSPSPTTPGGGQVLTIQQRTYPTTPTPDSASSIYSDVSTPRAVPNTFTDPTALSSLSIPTLTVTPSEPTSSFWSPTSPEPDYSPSGTPSPSVSMSNYTQPSANPSRRSFSSPSPLSPVMEGGSEPSPIREREDSPTIPDGVQIPSFQVHEAEVEEGHEAGAGHDREDDETSEHDAGQDTLGPHGREGEGRKGIRWSVIPKTPRSRVAVREEFEEALKRMRGLVGDEGDEDGGEGREEDEGEGQPSPHITFAPLSDPEEDDGPRWDEVVRGMDNGRGNGSEGEVESYVGV